MDIPSEEQFLEAMRALARPIPNYLLERFSLEMLRAEDTGPAVGVALEVEKWFFANWMDSIKQPALCWLIDDRMVALANKRLSRKWVYPGEGAYARRLLHALTLEVDPEHYSNLSTCVLRWSKVQSTADRIMPASIQWYLCLLWALREYHYEPNTVPDFLDGLKQIRNLQEKVLAGFDAKREIDRMSARWTYGYTSYHSKSKKVERDIVRLDEQIEIMRDALPIRRGGGTARERLLIYRLWQACRAITYRAKPGVIQYVLLAQGIENQIDERNVEKMCADFKTKDRPSMYIRQLILDFRGDNHREEMELKRTECYRAK
ncbi:hypothetical protein [Paralcaligenes ureilyticus]|uniref:Uncharacterized protein n=1 Tax=Paralcaligenes ureilyticus TaxID=627131 RepID=A0A4R3MBP4_9BURK|nr:hypothetical protein [Paralcaligenes ureilyticus]TCT10960.1 hypothetical protein EDC26_101182 [Paralcaligenes ureilyticus]